MSFSTNKIHEQTRLIELPHVTNFRDIGGYIGEDGKQVKYGQFYRCAGLSQLDETDFQILKELNVKIIVDFRSIGEKDNEPDIIPPECEYYHFSGIVTMDDKNNLGNSFGGNLDMKTTIMEIIQKKIEMPNPVEYLKECYIIMAEQSQSFKDFFKVIKDNPDKPIAFHCTAGKDRTGVAAALILLSLGVSEEVVIEDYLLSNVFRKAENDGIKGILKTYIDKEEALEMIKVALEVNEELLLTYFNKVKELYGNWDNYFEKALGISKEDRTELKRRYLV